MKKIFSFLLLMAAVVAMPAFLTSCDEDEVETNETTNPEPDEDDDAKKLIGTWVGYNGTPGLDYTIKYTLTFYSSGKATEEYSSVSYGSGSMSGTYKYSNGEITEWDMKEGSVLANDFGDPSSSPWTVTFITSNEMKITRKSYSI